MNITPIGVIHTSHQRAAGTPLQPVFARGAEGVVEVFEPYVAGLRNLDGFERIWLLFWFHHATEAKMVVVPYRTLEKQGLFATRIPPRPNPIGLSCVRLLAVDGGRLRVAGVDMIDGSPLIDIKPYVPEYDVYPVERAGWVQESVCETSVVTADSRFERQIEEAGLCGTSTIL